MAKGEGKKSFIIYCSWMPFLEDLSYEQIGRWVMWLMAYTNDMNPDYPEDKLVRMTCKMTQGVLKNDLEKYRDKVERITKINEERKKRNEVATKSIRNRNDIASDNVNDNVNVNDNDNVNVNVNVNDNVLSNDNNNKENYIVSNDTIKESVENNGQYRLSLFEKFWKRYPKKVGKEKCKGWFLSKSRFIDETLLYRMILAIDFQKESEQWQKENGQFIPNPYTWLNQKRWQDVEEQNEMQQEKEKSEEPDLSFLDGMDLSGGGNEHDTF